MPCGRGPCALYPRDRARQEDAVSEFWSLLLVNDKGDGPPVLARYDGARPLAPWLIRVFQNAHVSRLRSGSKTQAIPDEDVFLPLPSKSEERWHEEFCAIARDWLASLTDEDLLLIGLRLRFRLDQRQVATVWGIHEGNISKKYDKLEARFFEEVGGKLRTAGWTGDGLNEFVLTEMEALLLQEQRLSFDALTAMLAKFGKKAKLGSA